MRLTINTSVNSSMFKVKEGFTANLFVQLSPPFPSVELIQFDGCKMEDIVHVRLNFFLFKQDWISKITEATETSNAWRFIDKGTKLPFFLKTWAHQHVIEKAGETQSVIVDQITYSTGTLVTDCLLYPILYFQFWYRRPIYRRVFG